MQNLRNRATRSGRDTTRSVTLESISAAIETMKSEMNEKIESHAAEHSREITNLKRSLEQHQENWTDANVEYFNKVTKLDEELAHISKKLDKELANISKTVEELSNATIGFVPTEEPGTSSLSDVSGKGKTSSKQTTKAKAPTLHKYIKSKMRMHYEQARKVLNNELPPGTKVEWKFVFDLTKGVRRPDNKPVLNAYVAYFRQEYEIQSKAVRMYLIFFLSFAFLILSVLFSQSYLFLS